jgi:hypothetical protein
MGWLKSLGLGILGRRLLPGFAMGCDGLVHRDLGFYLDREA